MIPKIKSESAMLSRKTARHGQVNRTKRSFAGFRLTLSLALALMLSVVIPAPATPPAGDASAATSPGSATPADTMREGAWYRGDLHCHSTHSDGDSPVAEVIASAEMRGLDFFVITDHDSDMEGRITHWHDPDYTSKRLILLYGVEWTTDKGHANIWALEPFDYTELWIANQELDAEAAIQSAHEAGAVFSINHPAAYNCCPWEYEVYEGVDFLEIWNAPYRFPTKSHLAMEDFWEPLLKGGRVIPGVGGSDCHKLLGFESKVNLHGNPTTWVYAEAPAAEAVLEGMKAGHVSVSYAPYGDRLDFTADADGDGEFELMCGDGAADTGDPILLRVQLATQNRREAGCRWREKARIIIYKNGEVLKTARVPRYGGSVTVTDIPVERSYYRAELRGRPEVGFLQRLIYGRTLALTNPIYVGFDG